MGKKEGKETFQFHAIPFTVGLSAYPELQCIWFYV